MKFYAELAVRTSGPISEARFDALADSLYDLDATDPSVEDVDLVASLADSRAVVTMVVEAADPAEAGTKLVL